jgi:cytochrome b6-f complex subunit 4
VKDTMTHSKDDSIPFFPDHVKTELRVVVGILVVVGIIGSIALFAPVGLGKPADPMNTPAHVKPEWYFLGLYQMLKFIPKTAGAVLPVLAVILVMIWPFIDRKKDRSPKTKFVRMVVVSIGMIILVALTIWGGMS